MGGNWSSSKPVPMEGYIFVHEGFKPQEYISPTAKNEIKDRADAGDLEAQRKMTYMYGEPELYQFENNAKKAGEYYYVPKASSGEKMGQTTKNIIKKTGEVIENNPNAVKFATKAAIDAALIGTVAAIEKPGSNTAQTMAINTAASTAKGIGLEPASVDVLANVTKERLDYEQEQKQFQNKQIISPNIYPPVNPAYNIPSAPPLEPKLEQSNKQKRQQRQQTPEQMAEQKKKESDTLDIFDELPQLASGGRNAKWGGHANAYQWTMDYYGGQAVSGGGACGSKILGGAEDSSLGNIAEYENTLNSATKDKLVEDIVSAMDKLGFKVSGATRVDKVKQLLEKLPNVKKPNFKSDAESQKAICLKIANVFNEKYGPIIDVTQEPVYMCQQISELIESLGTGMHAEFLLVNNEVKKVLKNLFYLKEQMDNVIDPLLSKIDSSEDQKLKAKTANYRDLHKLIQAETLRQIELMKNLLNVTLSKAETDLTTLIKHSKDLPGIIERLEGRSGTNKFGEVISKILRGAGLTAQYALIVQEALKKVGMSLDDYAKGENLRGIMDKVRDTLMSKDMTDSQLHEFLQSAELLYKNFYRNKDIAKLLNKMNDKSGAFEYVSYENGTSGGRYGGQDESEEYPRTVLDKRVEDRKVSKKMLIAAFARQLNEHFDRVVSSLNSLASKIGDGVPLSDQLDGLREALVRLNPIVMRQNIYIALSGYYNDALSKERRETFIAQMRLIKGYIDSILEMSLYGPQKEEFKQVGDSLQSMISLIEQYSDKIAQKFGANDSDVEAIVGGVDPEDFDVETVIIQPGVNALLSYYPGSKTNVFAKSFSDANKHIDDLELALDTATKQLEILEENYNLNKSELESLQNEKNNIKIIKEKVKSKKSDKQRKKAIKQQRGQKFAEQGRTIQEAESMYSATTELENDEEEENLLNDGNTELNTVKQIVKNIETKTLNANATEFVPSKKGAAESKFDIKGHSGKWRAENSVHDAIRKFDYYYKVAQIKNNLKKTGKELEQYAEKYEDIRAEAIAQQVNSIKQNRDIIMKNINEETKYSFDTPEYKKAAKQFVESQTQSKIKFWRTIEAIDEYLRVFTDGIVKHPSEIQDIKSMLDEVDVIHDWYNDASGKSLHTMFDEFPSNVDKNDNVIYPVDWQKESQEHYYKKAADFSTKIPSNINLPGTGYIAARLSESGNQDQEVGFKGRKSARKVIKGVTVLKNILNIFIHVGNKFGGESLYKKIFMTPTQIYANLCEYLEASAFSNGLYGGNVGANILNGITPTISLKGTNNFGLPTLASTTFGEREIIIVTFGSVTSEIKNWINRINQHLNLMSDKKQKLFYQNKIAVIKSAVGTVAFDQRQFDEIKKIADISGYTKDPNAIYIGQGQSYEGGALAGTNDMIDVASKKFLFGVAPGNLDDTKPEEAAVRDFSVYMRSVFPNMEGDKEFMLLDDMFVHVMKSMCAKVLTVVGTYDIFERPDEMHVMGPIRFIIGGGVGDIPKVENGATELYLRLPLLAEFYRDLFSWDDKDNDPNAFLHNSKKNFGVTAADDMAIKISMLPEAEGMFSGLIRLLFKKIRFVNSKNFSDSDVIEIIREVNNIYAQMLSKGGNKETITEDTIKAFVDEINKRYGIIRKKDRDSYNKEFGYHYDYADIDTNQPLDADYNILPGEDQFDSELEVDLSKRAPSVKYETGMMADDYKSKKSPHNVTYDHYLLFYRFRCLLDSKFRDASGQPGEVKKYSLRSSIKSASNQLKKETSDDERFKVVAKLVRGVGIYGKSDYYKYLLFHETVITGLNTLSAMHTLLHGFQLRVLQSDLKTAKELFKNPANQTPVAMLQALANLYYKDNGVGSNFGFNAQNLYNVAAGSFTAFVNGELVAVEIFESLFALGKDFQGLTNITFEENNGKVYVRASITGLKQLIEGMFENIRYFLDLLRPHIDIDMFNKYVDKQTPGSYYWLQEQIMEKLIVGREGNDIVGKSPYVSIDRCFEKVNSTLEELINYNLTNVFNTAISYDRSNLATLGLQNSQNGAQTPATLTSVDFRNNEGLDFLLARNVGMAYLVDPKYTVRRSALYDWNPVDLNLNVSLMTGFNQLLAKYLSMFFDKSTDKIYTPLINELASGAFNEMVMDQMKTFKDMESGKLVVEAASETTERQSAQFLATPPLPYGNKASVPLSNTNVTEEWSKTRKDYGTGVVAFKISESARSEPYTPTAAFANPSLNVLYTSLSIVLKNLLTSRHTTTQQAIYLLDNVAELSLFMKENMKANLPIFHNLFKDLLNKSEFYRELINKSAFKTNETANYNKVITQVVNGCTALLSSMEQVMRELGDDPKFMELKHGSIQEYNSAYGKNPLMPLSSLLYVLKNARQTLGNRLDLLPFHKPGSNEFKFNYGTRGIFGNMKNKVLLEHMPGVKEILDNYNSTVDKRDTADSGKYTQLVSNTVALLRYITEAKHYKGNMTFYVLNRFKSELFTKQNFVTVATLPKQNGNRFLISMSEASDPTQAISVYVLNKPSAYLAKVIELTESSFKDEQIGKIVNSIATISTKESQLTIDNILDLNIVPINIHAMMRDIPLVNLYNYSYTFDRLVIEMYYGIMGDFGNQLIAHLCEDPLNRQDMSGMGFGALNRSRSGAASAINSPKEMFVALMLNPYRFVWSEKEWLYLDKIFQGDDNLPLDRPKFLSDQVAGKLLFRDMFTVPDLGNQYTQSLFSANNPHIPLSLPKNLNYIDKPGTGRDYADVNFQQNKINTAVVSQNAKELLQLFGKLRFNTKFVRNLMFLVNIYRTLRLKLRTDLTYNKNVVVRSHAVTRDDNTEFILNQTNRPTNRERNVRDRYNTNDPSLFSQKD